MLNASDIAARLKLKLEDPERLVVVPVPDGASLGKGSAIDLRLGRWFLTFRQNRVQSVHLTRQGGLLSRDEDQARTKENFVPFGQDFILHPGRFVLGSTLEWLKIPGNLSGYVAGKSSLGRHGLVIETAAGLHPGFSGCLTLELANMGEVPLIVRPGMRICQVFLHQVGEGASVQLGRFSNRRKPVLLPPQEDIVLTNIGD